MTSPLILGVNPPIKNSEYHKEDTYLSSSGLKLLLKDPEQFYREKILKENAQKSSAAMELGSYVHCVCLEPELLDEEFAFFQGWRKAGKDWEDFKANPAHKNKIILSIPQVEQGNLYAQTVKGRQEALQLLSSGQPEVALTAIVSDVPVKMKADYINLEQNYIADIKTTGQPAGLEYFKLAVDQFGYDLSAALYCMIAEEVYGRPFDFFFITISKVDRQCDVYKLSSSTKLKGKQDVFKALNHYKKCVASGVWTTPAPTEAAPGSDYIIEAV